MPFDPIFKVKESVFEGKPLYELTLSEDNFMHLAAGCPFTDSLTGRLNGFEFHIELDRKGGFSNSFKARNGGFYTSVGVPYRKLPYGASMDEVIQSVRDGKDDLEKAINSSGILPIKSTSEEELGYAIIRIESNSYDN